jgi:RNA polymerase sigma-70 factor (ECF subfamily)
MALADIPVDLIKACRDGDRPSLERLLHLISPDLYRIAFSMLRDQDDTDEVVQETLVRLFRHIQKLKEPERFAAWVMRIAVNQVQTWRMKRNRQRTYEWTGDTALEDGVIVFAGMAGPNPREAAAGQEIRREIESAMATLPDRQQTAVMLFELEGCSIKEIAAAMACSEGAVKFNLHEARRKLQGRLGHLVHGLTGKARLARRDAQLAEEV